LLVFEKRQVLGHITRMRTVRWVLVTTTFGVFQLGMAQESAPVLPDDDHAREELGVNEYTTPSIELIFRDLGALVPLPFEKVKRSVPNGNYPNRFQLALNFGGLIADGFLAVQAEQTSGLDEIGRALLKQASALGVGDRVTRHSKSMLDLGRKGDWQGLRRELSATQAEVERAMMELRDEEMAHMVSLGGWLRGLEIASETVAERYTPDNAKRLTRPELMDYFIDRLDTLNPSLRRTPLMLRITSDLKTVRSILTPPEGKAVFQSDVKQVRDIVENINNAISKQTGPPENTQEE
jgi:hypothetical protein